MVRPSWICLQYRARRGFRELSDRTAGSIFMEQIFRIDTLIVSRYSMYIQMTELECNPVGPSGNFTKSELRMPLAFQLSSYQALLNTEMKQFVSSFLFFCIFLRRLT